MRKKPRKTTDPARRHLGLPYSMVMHENFKRLSPYAVKMLIDISKDYHGFNNGDLSATWSALVKRNWRSRCTTQKAIAELEHYGFIVKTRQGGRRRCNLYGITWKPLDECNGKLDESVAKGPSTLGAWTQERPVFEWSKGKR